MKNFKRFIVVALAFSMVLSIAACNSESVNTTEETTTEQQTEIATETSIEAEQSRFTEVEMPFKERLINMLGISSEDITITDGSSLSYNAFEGEYLWVSHDGTAIQCVVYDDTEEAVGAFEEFYNKFLENFDLLGFDGEYVYVRNEDYGFVVVNGSNPGTNIFGDRNVSGNEFYYGMYLYDNEVITIFNMESNIEGTSEVIRLLGLPMADGTNC